MRKQHPTQELIAYRLAKADKCIYKFMKAFRGKAAVGLKLQAYAAMPRACALFLAPIIHWTGETLREALRW